MGKSVDVAFKNRSTTMWMSEEPSIYLAGVGLSEGQTIYSSSTNSLVC